jgi:hypothetical protein
MVFWMEICQSQWNAIRSKFLQIFAGDLALLLLIPKPMLHSYTEIAQCDPRFREQPVNDQFVRILSPICLSKLSVLLHRVSSKTPDAG